MDVSCPKILVPYFADHGFLPDKGRLTNDNAFLWIGINDGVLVVSFKIGYGFAL
jgi:hypothetical protein